MTPATRADVVGVIGPGIMGGPIAANLLAKGRAVSVYGRSPERLEELRAHGARIAQTPREVASPIVLSTLPDVHQLRELLDGPDGLLDGLRDVLHPILVVMSTTSPAQITALAADLAPHGVAVVDAPMSGGDKGARDATMTIMVGGATPDVTTVLPTLRLVGGTVLHMGELGAGALMKLCNQVVVAGTLTAVAEGLAMAEHGGLDLADAVRILQGGLANSAVLDLKKDKLLTREYSLGGSATNQLKDLRYAAEAFSGAGGRSPMTTLLEELFTEVEKRGLGEQDHSVVAELFRR